MSQEPTRQSIRTKIVNKRLKLEEKLEKRRIEAEIRNLKAQSKRFQELQVQELLKKQENILNFSIDFTLMFRFLII